MGTELKALLASLGVDPGTSCGCRTRAALMDRWGVRGCIDRRDEIVAWLRAQQKRVGWWAKLELAARAVAAGLWFNPRDVAGSLFDEARRRAEAKSPAAADTIPRTETPGGDAALSVAPPAAPPDGGPL